MIVMAALVFLPVRTVGAIGVAIILFHNLLDGIQVPQEVAFDGTGSFSQILWIILHQPGSVKLFGGASNVFFLYPLLPWIGVMAAGFAFGTIYSWNAERRRNWLLVLGVTASVLFIVLRLINVYGDPSPWAVQDTPAFTILSFLNTTKYPPSLLFLLMTLGPAMIVLAAADGFDGKALWQRIAITLGRVPLFYYLQQFFVAHLMAILLTVLAGNDISYFFATDFAAPPPDHGFSLGVTYLAWIAGLLILYPGCAWYSGYKRRHKHWLLSYL
jgi:uncharacterized membrane protein